MSLSKCICLQIIADCAKIIYLSQIDLLIQTLFCRYTVLFEVTKSKKSCETLGAEVYGKLQEGSKVCVTCQGLAMRRHLGYRCSGHGSLGKSTRWTALGNTGCHGRWIRLDERVAASYCGGNKNGTALTVNEPDFIFV